MIVRVLLFARLRDLVGSDRVEVEAPEGTTLGGLWELLRSRTPALQTFRNPPLMARNLEYAGPETPLSGDEEIAFLPPASGG
jgi:molybdopterin converting factor subunit 1